MAKRGDATRTDMLDLLGYSCLCSWCELSARCEDYNLHHRDTLMARINGYPVSCSNHQPTNCRGIEGVRP